MPTPAGHALAALALAPFVGRSRETSPADDRPSFRTTSAILIACACAPDLDLALRFVDGANHHRGISHSVGAAVIVGVAGEIVRRAFRLRIPNGAWLALAWASHALLDWMGVDTSPPRGLMALWPWSGEFVIAPFAVFYDVIRSFSLEAMRHNAIAAAIEVAILGPLAFLAWRARGSI